MRLEMCIRDRRTSPAILSACARSTPSVSSLFPHLRFTTLTWTASNQDVAGVAFSDFKDHTAEKLGRRGNQFTWWDLFKSAPDLVLKKFAEAELGDRIEKSATLGADPKSEKKEKKKSFFGKKKESGDGKELV